MPMHQIFENSKDYDDDKYVQVAGAGDDAAEITAAVTASDSVRRLSNTSLISCTNQDISASASVNSNKQEVIC
jgi:hypothetical protein